MGDDYKDEVARMNERELARLRARVQELEAQINTPEIFDFAKAVQLEAVHQRERWGTDHDAGKTDADWFWLIGYLSGKALHNPPPESGCGCPTNTQLLQALGLTVPPELALSADGLATGHLKKCFTEKKLHRIVTIAAAAANWHAAILGKTNMRPGIEPPTEQAAR
jgi:hypothetical protein